MDRAGTSTVTAGSGAARDPGPRRTRVLRGVLASTVAVLAACAAHVLAGGAMPGPVLLTAVLVLSWLPGVALIGVAVRLWRQVAVIVVAEGMLHAVLALQHGPGSATSAPWTAPSIGMAGMVGTVGTVGTAGGGTARAAYEATAHLASVHPSAVPSPVSMSMSQGGTMPAWMWVAHVAAAAATVLLWRRGEADVARLVALAGRGLGRLLRIPHRVRGAVPVAPLPLVAHRLGTAVDPVGTAHPRRGPPLAA